MSDARTIIGAGIAGLALAKGLRAVGFHVGVFEQTPGELISPRHAYTRGRVVLLGDAAHAVTTDLGQGACQALEDAAVLPSLLVRYPLDLRLHALIRSGCRAPAEWCATRDGLRVSLNSTIPLPFGCGIRWSATYPRA